MFFTNRGSRCDTSAVVRRCAGLHGTEGGFHGTWRGQPRIDFPIRYQRRHHYAFQFGTEASINLADDAGLLQLFQDANFAWVFIGIESPDEASLKETLKTQNTGRDMLTAVRALYTHGVDVLAGFIIGFDNDTLDSFDKQYRFITGACSATTASPNVSATKSVISGIPSTGGSTRRASAWRSCADCSRAPCSPAG
jgi:hypothetical protein